MEKIMKTKVRAVSVEIDGQNYMAIEFPIEVIEELKLVDGEILDVSVENGNLMVNRTGIIYHGDRET